MGDEATRATNSGGTGIATLLLGYTTGGARGFLLEPYDMTNYEHSWFVQDDWKLADRLTVNLGLRYDIFVPDTEKNNRLVNFDPVALELVYAGEGGTDRGLPAAAGAARDQAEEAARNIPQSSTKPASSGGGRRPLSPRKV